MVSTGLAFQIPEGYQMKIHPRSGISLKTPLRIANAPGCVDSDYRGELKVLLWNTSYEHKTPWQPEEKIEWNGMGTLDNPKKFQGVVSIRKGDRIAQAEIVPVICASFILTDSLSTTERTGGFGSTGTR